MEQIKKLSRWPKSNMVNRKESLVFCGKVWWCCFKAAVAEGQNCGEKKILYDLTRLWQSTTKLLVLRRRTVQVSMVAVVQVLPRQTLGGQVKSHRRNSPQLSLIKVLINQAEQNFSLVFGIIFLADFNSAEEGHCQNKRRSGSGK